MKATIEILGRAHFVTITTVSGKVVGTATMFSMESARKFIAEYSIDPNSIEVIVLSKEFS